MSKHYYFSLFESVVRGLNEAVEGWEVAHPTEFSTLSQHGDTYRELLRRKQKKTQGAFDQARRMGMDPQETSRDLTAVQRLRAEAIARRSEALGRPGRANRIRAGAMGKYQIPDAQTPEQRDRTLARGGFPDALRGHIQGRERDISHDIETTVRGNADPKNVDRSRRRAVAAVRLARRTSPMLSSSPRSMPHPTGQQAVSNIPSWARKRGWD